MNVIVIMGRGGTGKTSFTALLAQYLIEAKITPLLLIDLDPDQNLAEMLGIDLISEGVKTIAELIEEVFLISGGTTLGIAPSERIEAKIWEKGIYEGVNFDLLTVGTKWVEGCYCLPDASVKKVISSLTSQYQYIIIDSPAGLEHLNRKVTKKVDIFFDLMGASNKSLLHVKRAYRIIKELDISYRYFFTMGGCTFPESLSDIVKERTGFPYIGKISFDKELEEKVIKGESILSLSPSSPAGASVKIIMDRLLAETG